MSEVKVNNGNIEDALKRFKRQCATSTLVLIVEGITIQIMAKPTITRLTVTTTTRLTATATIVCVPYSNTIPDYIF